VDAVGLLVSVANALVVLNNLVLESPPRLLVVPWAELSIHLLLSAGSALAGCLAALPGAGSEG